jgi:Tfp pilus assembly protein PilN
MRHKCKEQDNSVTHLENELSDVNTRLKDTDKVLEEKSTLLQEKIHITSLQDEEIDSLKISLQNLEKEAAASNEQILQFLHFYIEILVFRT